MKRRAFLIGGAAVIGAAGVPLLARVTGVPFYVVLREQVISAAQACLDVPALRTQFEKGWIPLALEHDLEAWHPIVRTSDHSRWCRLHLKFYGQDWVFIEDADYYRGKPYALAKGTVT